MPQPLSLSHYNRINAESIAESGWLTLFNGLSQPRFYHHPDWYLAIDQFLLSQPLEFCCARRDTQPVALIPGFCSAQRHRFSAPVHDHLSLGDVLLHPSLTDSEPLDILDRLMAESSPPWWDWQINNLPAHAELAQSCSSLNGTELQMRQSRESAWFDLSESVPPGGKLRRNLNRLRSKLSDKGQIRLQCVVESAELSAAFDQFLALESAGWKGQSGQSTAIADNPALVGFYQRLLTPTYPGLQPVINLLWLDDVCIAAQFGLQVGSCLSLLKIAYDEDYSAFSPGSLLLQDVLAESATRSLQTLSLVTSPAWAARWHPDTEPVWHVTRYANNSGGLALKTLDRLKQSARARLRPAA